MKTLKRKTLDKRMNKKIIVMDGLPLPILIPKGLRVIGLIRCLLALNSLNDRYAIISVELSPSVFFSYSPSSSQDDVND